MARYHRDKLWWRCVWWGERENDGIGQWMARNEMMMMKSCSSSCGRVKATMGMIGRTDAIQHLKRRRLIGRQKEMGMELGPRRTCAKLNGSATSSCSFIVYRMISTRSRILDDNVVKRSVRMLSGRKQNSNRGDLSSEESNNNLIVHDTSSQIRETRALVEGSMMAAVGGLMYFASVLLRADAQMVIPLLLVLTYMSREYWQ